MKRLRHIITLSFLLTAALSCSKNENDVKVILPSNLQVQATVASDGSGLVTVNASAQNVNFFYIYFGETGEIAVTSTTGQASHTYTTAGSYTIRVEAHTTIKDFISQSTDVKIVKDGDDGTTPIPTTGYSTPESYAGMTLIWQDEFNGTALNETDWSFETGGGGWGNNELEYYRKENTTVSDGVLIITAKKESFSGSNYTSSRLITKGKKSFKFGRVDIRAALPKGQGIWPALWLLGSNIDDVGWPKCGEIDIMEMIGGSGREKTVYGTPHWWDTDQIGHASYGSQYSLSSGTFADQFHVFSIIWTADAITWYVDDIQYHTIDITPAEAPERFDEFRNNFFVIFNIAVGGDWPKNPDSTTVFPQRMVVDYVRVFQ